MGNPSIDWNREVLADALTRLRQKQKEPGISDPQFAELGRVPDLDEDQLAQVIDAVFWASLRRFEQHPMVLGVVPWTPTKTFEAQRFKEAHDLQPETLAAIGLACGSGPSQLLVHFDGGAAKIWGLGQVAIHAALVVSCDGPGQVKLRVAGQHGLELVGFVEDGRLKPVVLTNSSLFRVFSELTLGDSGLLAALKTDALATLIANMRALGMGGTVVFLADEPTADIEMPPKQTFHQKSPGLLSMLLILESEIPEVTKNDKGHQQRLLDDWKAMARSRIAALARLTCVDGAVICSMKLEALGFGAKLRAAKDAPMRMTTPFDNSTRELKISEAFKGTRHQSAARLVAAHLGRATALVVSHDGPVTWFGKDAHVDMVHAVGRLELLLP